MKLSTKLFLSHAFVIAVGMLVLAVVAAWIGPAEFQQRMMHGQTGTTGGARMGQHMAEADEEIDTNFRAALNTSLLVASLVAVAAAAISSWFVSRRIVQPIRSVVRSSHHIADGHYEQRLNIRSGDELGELVESFNRMAAALAQTEEIRRQLLADVTHELKTPLASIKGYMEGLEDGVLPATPETFQTVHREASRMQRLVQDLTELSHVESRQITLRPETIAADTFLRYIVQKMQPQFEARQIQLRLEADEHLTLHADRDRTEQILTNLLSNALQYTPEGGKVIIRAAHEGSMTRITVQDTGIGIAAADLPHIFQRFYRADKSRARRSGGSGIGLTITRHLVEAQGGKISVESAGSGQGSTFTIRLPA